MLDDIIQIVFSRVEVGAAVVPPHQRNGSVFVHRDTVLLERGGVLPKLLHKAGCVELCRTSLCAAALTPPKGPSTTL